MGVEKPRHDEAFLKALVLSKLRREGRLRRDALIASELKMPFGGARIDLAVLEQEFVGVEIKSPLDSLKRLDKQLSAYLAYFDSVILVAATKHLPALTGAFVRNIEVWEFNERAGTLVEHREKCADAPQIVAARPRADFLTKAERERFADAIGLGRNQQDREALQAAFEERYGETSKAFWKVTARREVRSCDLHTLSRFHDRRLKQVALEKEREEYWSRWRATARQLLSAA